MSDLTGTPLEWVREVASTQDVLLARARRGEGPQALATTSQTAGRGRRGRVWQCEPGAGLAMSVLMRPARDDGWTWLPLLAGVAVVDALDGLGATGLSLKWPNDVLAEDVKLAGLLAERVEASKTTHAAFVLGTGINLHARGAPAGARALDQQGVVAGAEEVAQAVLQALSSAVRTWERNETRVMQAYRDRCGTLGRSVQVALPSGDEVVGRADSIDEHGRLVVVTANGAAVPLSAGDVVHLRPRG